MDAADISSACPPEWLRVTSDIADKAIPESIYTFDINTQVVGLLQGIAIDALDDIGVETSWNNRINGVIAEIEKIMKNNQLAGNNPRLNNRVA